MRCCFAIISVAGQEPAREAPFASVKITEGNPGELRLDSTSIDGEATSADIPIDELRAVTLAVAAGQVIWESACTEIPS